MLAMDSASWLSHLVVLVPVALAARRRPRSGEKKPPRPPRKERFPWYAWLIVVLSLGAMGLTLGIRLVRYYWIEPSLAPGREQNPLPSALNDMVQERVQAEV